MNRFVLLSIVLLLLIVPTIISDCDEERIRITLSELINSKVKEIKDNTDQSFQAYERFNSEQLAVFLTKNDEQLQQGVLYGVIALFAVVLFTSSMWGFVRIKREKVIMMHILDEVRIERKFLEEFIQMFNMNPEEIKAQVEALHKKNKSNKQKVPQIEPVALPKKEKKGLFRWNKQDKPEERRPEYKQVKDKPVQEEIQAQVQAQQQSIPSVTPKVQGHSVPPMQVLSEPLHPDGQEQMAQPVSPVQQFVDKPATDAHVMSELMKYYQQQEEYRKQMEKYQQQQEGYKKQMEEYRQQQEFLRQNKEQEERLNKLKADLESMYSEKQASSDEFRVKIKTHEPAKKSVAPVKKPVQKSSKAVKKQPEQEKTKEPEQEKTKDELDKASDNPSYSVTYDV